MGNYSILSYIILDPAGKLSRLIGHGQHAAFHVLRLSRCQLALGHGLLLEFIEGSIGVIFENLLGVTLGLY